MACSWLRADLVRPSDDWRSWHFQIRCLASGHEGFRPMNLERAALHVASGHHVGLKQAAQWVAAAVMAERVRLGLPERPGVEVTP